MTKKEPKKPLFRRCAILSANFGNYDPEVPWVQQNRMLLVREARKGRIPKNIEIEEEIDFTIERCNDENFPGRELALTHRLKPALIKMFGWEFFPNYNYYVWVDASKTLTSPEFGSWMIQQLGDADFAVFKHPERKTIQEEYEFVRRKLDEGNKYLLERYAGEQLDEQWKIIHRDRSYYDDALYASTGFIYRPKVDVKAMFRDWWFHKSRYLLHDQLALPYVLKKHPKIKVNVIDENIYKLPLWEHTRKPKRR